MGSAAGARCSWRRPTRPTSTPRSTAAASASPCRRRRSPTRRRSPRSARCSSASSPATHRSSSIPARSRPSDAAGRGRPGRRPLWWPALTDYVAQMQAAWFAFLTAGRAEHPRLRVLFAMLAGGAPLQLERYAARCGSPVPEPDPLVFYDTSSYGPRMIGAVRDAVGGSQLVYGSDRPVVDPAPAWPDPELRVAALATNPSRLFKPDPKGALA